MKKTPLYKRHLDLGAKLVDFAGYQMPIQYSGVVNEHNMVRKSAGLFDVSHMGEFIISGDGAEDFLNYLTVNDLNTIKPWQAQYSAMCFEDGGIIDDLIIYRYPDHFMLVVNCSNIEKDLDWLMANKPQNVNIMDISQQTSLIALQGPNSRKILQSISDVQIDDIDFYCFKLEKIWNSYSINTKAEIGPNNGKKYSTNDKIFIKKLIFENVKTNKIDYKNSSDNVVRVIKGTNFDYFSKEAKDIFFKETYSVTSLSDRMGMRLQGSKLKNIINTNIESEGLIKGVIQVPADGNPIILLSLGNFINI